MDTFKSLVPKWLVCLILVVFIINPTVCASASSDDDEPQEILKEGIIFSNILSLNQIKTNI